MGELLAGHEKARSSTTGVSSPHEQQSARDRIRRCNREDTMATEALIRAPRRPASTLRRKYWPGHADWDDQTPRP